MKTWLKGGIIGAVIGLLIIIWGYVSSNGDLEGQTLSFIVSIPLTAIFIIIGIVIGWLVGRKSSR